MLRGRFYDFLHPETFYKIITALAYIAVCYVSIKIIDRLIKYFGEKTESAKDIFGSALVFSLKKPMKIFYWTYCFYRIFILLNERFVFFKEVKALLVMGMTLWVAFRFISAYAQGMIKAKIEKGEENINLGDVQLFKKISQTSIVVLVLFMGIEKLGVQLRSLIAIGGVGGMAIGFASKDMLANIFGGLMIHLDKPFAVGDWICSEDRKIEGIVDEIGWRQTKVMSFAKFPLFIPNSIFSNVIIENKGLMISRKIEETIVVSCENISIMEKIAAEATKALESRPDVNKKLAVVVAMDNIKHWGINLAVTVFTTRIKWPDFMLVKQEILIDVVKIVEKNGGKLVRNAVLPVA
ncbi:MAG: mechanosensitive ion channel family protein [Rickettsiales bacterium]|jgi:MscS family membrane protein|nr:mechanosensitive ion channel family protein [Rickettsiales bacterium]